MGYKIALVESDTHLAASLSRRVKHFLPASNFIVYEPKALQSDHTLFFREDVVLFDSEQTDEKELLPHLPPDRDTPFISICQNDLNGKTFVDGMELSNKICTAIDNERRTGEHCKDTLLEIPIPLKEKKNRIFLSFADTVAREEYIRTQTSTLIKKGIRIIRLNLMPGIAMPSYEYGRENQKEFSGISQLLLRIEQETLQSFDLLSYLQQEKDQTWSLGLPERSDDLISCPVPVIVKLMSLLRRLAEEESEPTVFICVAESIPFSTLMDICPLFEELHLIQENPKKTHYTFEFSRLFRQMPSSCLRFVYHSSMAGAKR